MGMPLFRAWLGDRRANTAMLFALSLPVLVGVVGLGVETGYWYYEQRELQTAADIAAVAGAVEKRNGSDSTAIYNAALTEAIEHGFALAEGTIDVNDPPSTGAYQDQSSVEVLLTMPTTRFFSQIFATDQVTMNARGVATSEAAGEACVLALDTAASGALTFTGNALTLLNGCTAVSNSLSDNSLIVTGSAEVTAACAMAAGGVSVDDGLTVTDCPEAQDHAASVPDPYDDLAEPPVSGSCLTMPSGNGAATLSPGRYCGGGTLKGDKTLSSGVYVIDGGDFKINSGANIAGTGVTFFFTGNATSDFNGNATINFSAQTSGGYKGMLFWGDDANSSGTSKFNGNASSKFTGAMYFPKQDVEFLGNFSGNNGCMRIVANTIKFTGSSTMNTDCTAEGLSSIPIPGRVVLVE